MTDDLLTGDQKTRPTEGEHLMTDQEALEAIRNALADMCPAWALEWPAVREAMDEAGPHPHGPDREIFTAQDVRDEANSAFDAISTVLRSVGL